MALARVTLARMSEALAVQMNGFGSVIKFDEIRFFLNGVLIEGTWTTTGMEPFHNYMFSPVLGSSVERPGVLVMEVTISNDQAHSEGSVGVQIEGSFTEMRLEYRGGLTILRLL